MLVRLIVFLVLNFAALGLGSIFTSQGVPSEWYAQLDKAPWTPPGWVFGVAWTSIMAAFAFYMAYLWPEVSNKKYLVMLYLVQWILNVSWNPVFFYFHNIALGLILITALTLLVTYLFYRFWPELGYRSLFIAPYVIWLLLASSLNAYILVNN